MWAPIWNPNTDRTEMITRFEMLRIFTHADTEMLPGTPKFYSSYDQSNQFTQKKKKVKVLPAPNLEHMAAPISHSITLYRPHICWMQWKLQKRVSSLVLAPCWRGAGVFTWGGGGVGLRIFPDLKKLWQILHNGVGVHHHRAWLTSEVKAQGGNPPPPPSWRRAWCSMSLSNLRFITHVMRVSIEQKNERAHW